MHRFHFTLALAALALLFPTVAARAQSPSRSTASAVAAPVPPALLHAKTLFLSNAGADSGLFPSPYSGSPSRGYDELYADLAASHRFRLVSNPASADLVLELRLTAPYIPYRPHNELGLADRQPIFRLVIYDRPTHYILWALTRPVETALLQRTSDRNFDSAVHSLAQQFLQLAGPPPATAP
ncbi:MAG TPA: hypothetical protein VND90_09610 [Terracidiphilus sp.]|nr:hypothetical protein [Terracidiphilus sp.]